MRLLALLFILISPIFALEIAIESLQADFEQRIVDEKGKSILYRGTLWAQRPDAALWHYTEPVEKRIYVRHGEVIIIEPDLEQAVIRRLNEDIDLLTILARAEETGPERYEARYGTQIFDIQLKKGVIDTISYRDGFDNRVTITFSAQRQNESIDPARFEATIPGDYDIIR